LTRRLVCEKEQAGLGVYTARNIKMKQQKESTKRVIMLLILLKCGYNE
jgi:hypothetical protein